MVQKRGGSPTTSPMTRERRQAMATNTVKKEEEATPAESATETSNKKATNEDMDKIKEEFVQLGRDLNMDTSTSDAAWASYDAIKQNYTLEVGVNKINKIIVAHSQSPIRLYI